jgi:hypothetical protein
MNISRLSDFHASSLLQCDSIALLYFSTIALWHLLKLVGVEGIEPPWVTPLDPKSSASASSATRPRLILKDISNIDQSSPTRSVTELNRMSETATAARFAAWYRSKQTGQEFVLKTVLLISPNEFLSCHCEDGAANACRQPDR